MCGGGARFSPRSSAQELAASGVSRLSERLPEALEPFERSGVLCDALGIALRETIVAVRRAECDLFDGATDDEIVAPTRERH